MIKGHKFGCDFMLYEEDPNTCHATYLLFVNQPLQLNHMTRLADICKKRCLFVDDDNGNLSFYELSREKG